MLEVERRDVVRTKRFGGFSLLDCFCSISRGEVSQSLSHHSSPHPSLPNLLSVYLAMSALVFQVSFCRLLESILKPD